MTEDLEKKENEWERQERDMEDMNQRFDKLFSMFPNMIKFDLSCHRHWDIIHRATNEKSVSVGGMNGDFKSSYIVRGSVIINYRNDGPTDIEITDIDKKDYGSDKETDISDEDAKYLLITAIKAVYKTDAHEHISVERSKRSINISIDSKGLHIGESKPDNSYHLIVPIIEIKNYDSRRFNWFQF